MPAIVRDLNGVRHIGCVSHRTVSYLLRAATLSRGGILAIHARLQGDRHLGRPWGVSLMRALNEWPPNWSHTLRVVPGETACWHCVAASSNTVSYTLRIDLDGIER